MVEKREIFLEIIMIQTLGEMFFFFIRDEKYLAPDGVYFE
ncbi:hypothetical protein STRDD13_00335 [Streptococcus sp. DD13]|nr:hypothetical protein STRDD13_00335 [Streptococcus sp. DD13]